MDNNSISSLAGRTSVPGYLLCMWMSTGMKVTVGCWARLWLLCPRGGGTASLEALGSSSRRTRMRLAKVKGELAPGLAPGVVSPLPG